MAGNQTGSLQDLLRELTKKELCALDFLTRGSLTERVVSLVLGEVSLPGVAGLHEEWQNPAAGLRTHEGSDLTVVLFGGGTGLSNIVGGDSRRREWRDTPFTGLKEIFSNLHSIVCVTDDGGSTGELLKDFPFVALGDLRHVMLSSVSSANLKDLYGLDDSAARLVAAELHTLFNYRFISRPNSVQQLVVDCGIDTAALPDTLDDYLHGLLARLFTDQRMERALGRPQCLGNLLLASAIYEQLPPSFSADNLRKESGVVQDATLKGISEICRFIGAGHQAVLPCTTTPAQLQMLYANGVLVTSETKSGVARRGYPVDRVLVEFSEQPQLSDEVAELVRTADIIIMAPGSLYTSIIPILQTPGLADLIRRNHNALKLLISNIWVQKGETDATREAPERKFYVSDLILAYGHNISGGIQDLFSHVLTLDLADIPGSVLQSYAIEEKEPIYLDRSRVRELGLEPVEAYIFSRELLEQRNVIQHDPLSLALVVRVLWELRIGGFLTTPADDVKPPFFTEFYAKISSDHLIPCLRYREILNKLKILDYTHVTCRSLQSCPMDVQRRRYIVDGLSEIIWLHPDIHPDHLTFVRGVCLIDTGCWKRCQEWDNVFSFFDPEDGYIKIRRDQSDDLNRLEMAFLVGLGQSLLGNYAEKKRLKDVFFENEQVGRIYCLTIRKQEQLACFFTAKELDMYLRLSRMYPSMKRERLYTRVVNGEEGFTPPGLLFGLCFAWYLDNRFAPNIDYKMSIMKSELSYLVPEQVRIVARREQLVRFFRENVFRRQVPRVRLATGV